MLVLWFSRSVVSDSSWPHGRPPGPSNHGILQARILEWVVIPFSRGSSRPRDNQTCISWLEGGFSTIGQPGKPSTLISASHYTLSPSLLVNPLLFSHSVISDSLQPHGQQHARLPCPSLSPGVYSNSCPPSQWCHPTISSSVVPFSSCLQSFPASGSIPMSRLFTSDDQSTRASASASVLPVNIPDWFLLGLTGLISLQSNGLSRVFSSTTVWRHEFFGAWPFLLSSSHICKWLREKP